MPPIALTKDTFNTVTSNGFPRTTPGDEADLNRYPNADVFGVGEAIEQADTADGYRPGITTVPLKERADEPPSLKPCGTGKATCSRGAGKRH